MLGGGLNQHAASGLSSLNLACVSRSMPPPSAMPDRPPSLPQTVLTCSSVPLYSMLTLQAVVDCHSASIDAEQSLDSAAVPLVIVKGNRVIKLLVNRPTRRHDRA
jgi:hypothetical protein